MARKPTYEELEQQIRRLEQALEEKRSGLDIFNPEKRTSASTADVAAAREKTAETVAASSDLLPKMFHELRTPLNAIMGFSRLLERDPSMSKAQTDKLKLIHNSGQHMLALINDILNMIKIETGRATLELEKINLNTLITDIADTYGHKASGQHLQFKIEREEPLPKAICCDHSMLRQVLFNLMRNVAMFTPKGSITLRIGSDNTKTSSEPPSTRLCFEITDTGVDFKSREIDTLFEPFALVGNLSVKTSDTGLGLAISRRYARLMGGDITVTSKPGQYTTFTLTVPVQIISEPVEPVQSHRVHVAGLTKSSAEYRVLAVDDSATSRLLLSELLQEVGITVQEAENGEQAVAVYQQWQPDLIFMDMRMPVMDGMAATKAIRAIDGTKKTPIIALTAQALDENQSAFLASGCDDVIFKPINEDGLFDIVERYSGMALRHADQPADAQSGDQNDSRKISPERTARLPAQTMAALKAAALCLNIEETQKAIETIRPHDSAMAKALTRMVESFDFKRIIEAADLHIDIAPK